VSLVPCLSTTRRMREAELLTDLIKLDEDNAA